MRIPNIAFLTLTLSLLPLLGAGCASASPEENTSSAPLTATAESPVVSPSDPIDGVIDELVQLMRAGLDRETPSALFTRRLKRETVFDGSYDWHSCVIAHWALLVHARQAGDAVLRREIRDRLPIEALEYESGTLRNERTFRPSWPYHESWFLMLLSELGRDADEGPAARDRLNAIRRAHEERLFEALAERPFPEYPTIRLRPRAIFSGHYNSWLWTYLLLRSSEPISDDARARLATLRRSTLLPGRGAYRAAGPFEAHRYDFLWVPALFELEEPGWNGAYEPGETEPWPAAVSLGDVHILGRELCRFWPIGEQPEARARVVALLNRRELWAEDFEVVSHWIPQFLFIGRWLRARPLPE